MTPVGHSLIGATIALTVIPSNATAKRTLVTLGALVLLANLPDWPLPWWGHERYDISHSIFSIGRLVGISLFAFLRSPGAVTWAGGTAVVMAGAIAPFSHLLLDTTYNHGIGLAVFWPFGTGRIALPLPWFETLKTPLPAITPHSLHVFAIEFLFYGVIFLIVLLGKRVLQSASSKTPNELGT